MKLITIEEHYLSERIAAKITEFLKDTPGFHLAAVGDFHDGVTELGKERIAYMDGRGIDMQVVSYAGGYPAVMEKEYAVPLCREVNDELKELTDRYPDRFRCFANLPLSSPQDAAKELERCVKELGFVGTLISGHYNGLPYDDPWYLPIFEKAAELDVPVYLHPGMVDPEVTKRYYSGAWGQKETFMLAGFGIGWHYDVGMQAVRMMTAGVFDKLPNLKVILGHWGEVVSFYMHRLDEMIYAGADVKKKFSDYFSENIYVDPSGMLDKSQLDFCLQNFPKDHILWGEDYPYCLRPNIRLFLEESGLPEETITAISCANAEKLLRL